MASSAKAYRVLSCLKILLIIFTVFFLCTGVLFLATGIYGLMALEHYFLLTPDINISMTPSILCGIGGLVILSGLFGFLSAFKNNKCMINCYCLLLGMVFVAEVAGGVTALIYMNQIEESFEKGFTNALTLNDPDLKASMDKAQAELQCCGVNTYADWFETSWAQETRQCGGISARSAGTNATTVPVSCCRPSSSNSTVVKSTASPSVEVCYCGRPAEEIRVNKAGCLPVLFGTSGQTLQYLLAATFGVAATQLFGIGISICIYRKLLQISSARRHY